MIPDACPICHKKTITYDKEMLHCTSCGLYNKPLGFRARVMVWAEDKLWWPRVPVIALFAWLFLLCAKVGDINVVRNNPLGFFDFGMHELGHYLFIPFGEFMVILGGSLFQCLVPLLWMIGFIQQKWYFAASLCWCWLGLNLYDVAVYAADARARVLSLAGPGALFGDGSDAAYDRSHDWYQILLRTNHLQSDIAIARGLRIAGAVCFIIGLALGTTLVCRMLIHHTRNNVASA